jgi:exodeoxyribonuclease V alpha subunit
MQLSITGEFQNFRFKSETFSVCNIKVLKACPATPKGVARVIKKDHLPALLRSARPGNNKNIPVKGSIVPIAGAVPEGIFFEGARCVFSGEWGPSKWGYQLKVESIEHLAPGSREGILRFLSSGLIKGVGPGIAEKLVETFGEKTLDVLNNTPEKIMKVRGIGGITAEKIISSFQEQKKVVDLIVSLCSLGLSTTYAKKVLKQFGNNAPDKIKENPYILIEVRGIGFLRADAIAKGLGIEAGHPSRIHAGILYALEYATYKEGHSFLPYDILLDKSRELLNVDRSSISFHLSSFPLSEITVFKDRAYLKELYDAEKFVANKIGLMAYRPSVIEKEKVSKLVKKEEMLTDEQREAVKAALMNGLTVITGLPGTGKTFSLKSILSILKKTHHSYALCAPTGKAAKRIEELTGEQAVTVHRLLEAKWNNEKNQVRFGRNETRLLDEAFVIVDEVSMVDILLMKRLMKAIGKETSLILVGDYNQLPPVGPGSVLKDVVRGRLCSISELKKIQRQAEDSAIIRAAHSIYAGKRIEFFNKTDLIFLEEEDPERIRETIVQVVKSEKYASVEKTQVLSPIKKGPVGTERLNIMLKEEINLHNLQILKEMKYYVMKKTLGLFSTGDKVIQLENNYQKEVFNGETGYIVEIDEKEGRVCVLFDNKVVVYKDYEVDQIGLAYALTVHKFQGSEADCVIMPVTTSHYIMLYRNLFYTALTRARKTLVFVGTKKALAIAIINDKQVLRYSGLAI